ncbi:MAG TPA: HNH endonuclease [Jiangellaceae bacterium]
MTLRRTAMTRRHRNTGPDAATTLTVVVRSGGRCEICGWWDDYCQIHHRRPRAMGGTDREDTNSPANLLRACITCHQRIESRRGEALHNGWLVSQYDNPATVPVLITGNCWKYLTEEGEYTDDPPGER